MRRLVTFPCAGETLVGTLDEAGGTTGLLIVSGGNEIRIGAHRGMALLAARLAQTANVPVFRFDRRGIGDSTGYNGGFASAAADITAAVAAFRTAAPHVGAIAAFGNCDAASAILLHGGGAFHRLLLANPWVVEQADALPPAAAIRARYAARLRDPANWQRLLRGNVNLSKLIKGLWKISSTPSQDDTNLPGRLFAALKAHPSAHIILAKGDATAIAFVDAARRAAYRGDITSIATDSHSFAHSGDSEALFCAICRALG